MEKNDRLDPAYTGDRETGSVAPESAAESGNVVGRPTADDQAGFHEPRGSDSDERRAFAPPEAASEGGSFDGLGVPVADDTTG